MNLAREVSTWSKDPSTHCGAVFVGDAGQVLTQGYNGFPRNISDNKNDYLNRELKYQKIVHAEMNAIYNASRTGVKLVNSIVYVYGLPCCNECAKALIQVGVKQVVTSINDNIRWRESCANAENLFKEAGVVLTYI